MMTILTKNLKHFIGVLLFASFVFISCNHDSSLEVTSPKINANLDEMLLESLDLMEESPASALTQLDDIIKRADAIHSKYYSGKAKWYKAYIYDDVLEDVALAYNQYYDALEDILQTNDVSLKMSIYNNLGILYRMYEQYDAAISNYEEAIKFENELSKKQLSDLYYNYGRSLKMKGGEAAFLQAEQAFTQSLKLAEEIDHQENIALVYNEIGSMYKKLDNHEVARLSYSKIIQTFGDNSEMNQFVGLAYHNLGDSYMTEGKLEEAEKAFNKALEFKTVSSSIFITKYDLGTILMKSGQSEKAIATWKDALTESHNKNSLEHIKIYSDLTKVLSSENQVKEALTYSEIYTDNVKNILAQGEKYKILNERILFANVVSEYDEFNKPVPLFSRPLVILALILGFGALIYSIVFIYYRSKSKKKVSEVVSKIQTDFLDIKVD
ncbi:tetratricopeptide repeat protein [Ekhidna sp.]